MSHIKTLLSRIFPKLILVCLVVAHHHASTQAAAQSVPSGDDTTADPQSQRSSDKVTSAITSVLEKQAEAWNRGDIDGFMRHYWNSDQMSFCAGGGRTLGWSKVAARYKKKYTSPELMGKLTFDHLDVRSLSDRLAMVIGDWHLQRSDDKDNVGGNFTLILQRQGQAWRIIHDHTSSRSAAASGH